MNLFKRILLVHAGGAVVHINSAIVEGFALYGNVTNPHLRCRWVTDATGRLCAEWSEAD